MLFALQQFISEQVGHRAFSFIDVGCGDSSTVAPILANQAIKKYIGIDASKDILMRASKNLINLHCEKEFIAGNMLNVIPKLSSTVDIIFSSYAVHHLVLNDKIRFIDNCRRHLNPQGFLLLVDCVLNQNQNHDEWLDALKDRIEEMNHELTPDEIATLLEHPRLSDVPESIETFQKIAKHQSWSDFQVIIDKGIFAFMVFAK